jgi:pilus assembly protein FimV
LIDIPVSEPSPYASVVPAAALLVPELPTLPMTARTPVPPPSTEADIPMDFDLSSISLDLDKPVITRPQGLDSARTDLETIDFSTSEDDGSDPLSRKLELAEEFRQIGDTEGARDLLQEVIAKADGALRAKAQGMLDDLG